MRTLAATLVCIACLVGCSGIQAKPEATLGDMPSKGPVGKTMKANSEKFLVCGRDSVSIQTGSPQKLQLNFMIDAEGTVGRVEISDMTSPDPDLYDCVRRTLRKVKFPPPNDGKPKKITYPLVLRPAE